MSWLGEKVRNSRWRSLSGLLETELQSLPPFALAKILAGSIVLRAAQFGANSFLWSVARLPQNYSAEVLVGLAYTFEELYLLAQKTGGREGLVINRYSDEDPDGERVYLFTRACQMWSVTFAAPIIPAMIPRVAGLWKTLDSERGQCLKAMQYLDGRLSFGTGLPGMYRDLLTTDSIVSLCNESDTVPTFRS